jgi:uncharacterized protein (DUF58 family)
MRITGRGVGILVAGAVLVLIGAGFNYPELAAVGAAGVLAVLMSLAAGMVRPRLSVTRGVDPDHVMRGAACQVALEVGNTRPWGALTVVGEDRCAQPGSAERRIPIPLVRLRPRVATTVHYPVPTGRRGLVRLGPLRVGRRDPFGLTRVHRTFGTEAPVWVYPYLHPIAAVPAGFSRNLDGLTERVPHGSITFDALREYVPGDDLRHVHWRTSARIGELMVRERVDTSRPRLVVLLDDRSRVHRGDTFEDACEAAGSVVAAALREDLAVHLLTASGTSLAASVESTGYLDALAEARLYGEDEVERGLAGIVERARQMQAGDTLVCLSGRPSASDLAAMVSLRGTYASIVVAVFGPQEAPLAGAGFHVISAQDGADFARLWDGVWA